MLYKKIYQILLLLFITVSLCTSQDNSDILHENHSFYFVGISIGKISSIGNISDKNLTNFGWSFSMENWPHIIKIAFENNLEFTEGGTPRFIDGFNSKVIEFNLIYDHLLKIPKVNTVFFALGSGIGLVHMETKENTIGIARLGIPIEIKIGFLYPNKKLRLLDFGYYSNINSIENFSGWKINFNISFN